jgi:hypothetical protein
MNFVHSMGAGMATDHFVVPIATSHNGLCLLLLARATPCAVEAETQDVP